MGRNDLRGFCDTPWHVGVPKMLENDTRRHKAWCVYYDARSKKCMTSKSACYDIQCGGSSHCTVYKESQNAEKEYNETSKEIKRHTGNKWVISINDIVTLRNLNTNKEVKYQMIKLSNGKQSDIASVCVGKNCGNIVSFKGENYKIIAIK